MNRTKLSRYIFRYLLFVGLAGMMGACATSHIPAPDTSNAEAKIKQAQQVNARQYAPLAIHNARQKLEKAKKLIDKEENKKAKRLVEEASVDAQLAVVTARSAKAQQAIDQLHKTIKVLKKQINENQQTQGGS